MMDEKMITVGELMKKLQKYPLDAFAYAYEGEYIGVVVVDSNMEELGFISTEV